MTPTLTHFTLLKLLISPNDIWHDVRPPPHPPSYPLQPEVWGGHLLEEDGGGANVLGGAEAQDGSSATDEPPWDASAPSTG